MQTVNEFLNRLASNGVKLSVEAGQLNCYAPKGTLTSDLKAGILEHKPQLIALLESIAKKPARVVVPSAPREFPLSAGQKGLYILDRLHPGMSAYNVPLCFRIVSEVNAELMAKAWSAVLDHFPILTARIVEKDGSPFHLLDDACRAALRQRAVVAADGEVLDFLRREAKAPFDLNRGPLTRADLFALPDRSSILLLNVHHIIFDGVSAVTLIRSLLTFYEQLSEGKPLSLGTELPGFERFVTWEESLLASPKGAAHAKFWQKQLEGELPAVELPPDWRRPATASYDGRTLAAELPSELVPLIRDFSRSHSTLPSALFLGAFQLLLHQYTNEPDVIIGMPVMGRASQEFASEIGYFINMIPLRAQCDERIRAAEFLRKAQGTMLDALYHSSYPFPLMVDKLQPRSERHPVFQVSFAYQNYVKGGDFASLLNERALKLEHVEGIYQEGDSDFGVEVFETEGSSYRVHLQYNPALYADGTIEGVFERYCVLLRAIVEDPTRFLDEYAVLTPPERQKLLFDFNETAAEYPSDRCIHELFAERAALAPDDVAVVSGDVRLTYGDLLAKSRDLALDLQSQGVGPDSLAGLCMERSPELVTGLLGILQAGGAYVPLDPNYPDDRLGYMLRDSRAAVVLTQEKLRGKLEALMPPGTRLVALDTEWPEVERRVAALNAARVELQRSVEPHHLAYVIYTSGSTGQPKGVMVPHRGLVNHATWFAKRLGLTPADRVLQFASLSFDTAAEEMFPAWISGAALVLRADGPPPAPADFFRMVEAAGITVLDLPTAYWHELADAAGQPGARAVPASIRAVIIGGEAASGERLEKWSRAAGSTLLLNTYGPTESTIIVTAYEPAAADAACVALPIGRPIANTRLYVLDEQQQPVPAGIGGELYIGGDGVARGYLNRPELTADRFIADPFHPEPGARLYRTGDRVRYRRDGVLEFLGRADDQVKIRGFRIEPGEIEAALRQHPAVRDAVVLPREDKTGDRRLIAFVVTHGNAPVPAAELRDALKASLPDFMIPAGFVSVEKIPTLPNGKLDRRALGRLEVTVDSTRAYVAPRTDTERRLVAIWAEVLNLAPERIGVHENFFELGGHSLLATRVISKVRAELDLELPLKAVFERPTVAELARLMSTAARRDVPPILPVDRAGHERLPLSFAQERLWFIDQLEPESAGYNVPGAVLLRGDVDAAQLERAFNRIIERHENLRTVFPSEDGRARQVILDRVDFKLDRVDLTHYATKEARDAEAMRLCRAEAAAPFDLARGPLFRGVLIRLAPGEHVLMLNMHHIVSDGWSLGVFVREFGVILESLRQGGEAALPALPIQYADYSVWQRNWLEQGGVLERQLAYWKQKLAGMPESLELPADEPRPAVQSFAGATRPFTIDARVTAQLKQLAEQHGATLYMVLVAAVKALLHRYSGQDDICIGSPIANRQYAETEGLIGMFVNTLALRDRVDGDEPFATLLARVKTTCLEAYEHQDAPFEKVVEAVRPQRNMAITPLFQVMVILQNAGSEELDPAVELYPLEGEISKFDLTIELTETADGLAGAIEYSTALYKPQTIARMVEHLSALCRAIVATPSARVSDLELLGEPETRRLLVDFNATAADYPKDGTLHQLFGARAELHPEKTAVVCAGERLSYGELRAKSHDLALYLQSQGVRPDTLVGICMERTPDMLMSMLGVLEAGGAYVPLDPNYPGDRLEYMLHDGRPALVLTQASLQEKLRAVTPAATQLVAVDAQKGELEERVAALKAEGAELLREVGPHHLAYVIYTSGSTGQPKGVAIEHHSPVTLVHWAHEVYSADELAGTLASTSICFDLSVYEIFVTLAAGGTIVLAADALALADLPERESVTLVNTVPSAMEELVRLGAIPRSVRTINLAGEPLPARLVDKIYDTTAAGKVFDLYGPSEDTTYSTWVLRTKNGPQTIGRPIANTQVYILDRNRRIQPIGVPGELYIGGDGLARGYLHRPELTAEKFVENPFTPGTRMYRTGDLARWKDDGTLQYLGRIDTQVKVRGFRIEIGEIEARLGQHPQVQDCAVIAQGEGASRQLVAFYRCAATDGDDVAELPVEELRGALLRTLPEYMVPAAFVSLAAIPLTPNGKVDRRALARIDVTVTSGQAYVAPRNETERQLVAVWAEVLGLAAENVGVNDRFFELGGHSLLATQLISKVRVAFGVDIPLKAIFERNTVADFADLIATAKANDIPAIVPVDRTQLERLPLSFAQERLWFINQLEPESAAYNVPGAVRLEGAVDVDLLDAAFNLLIERHETLRTIFRDDEGQAHQVILDRLDFALERLDVSHLDTMEARERAAEQVCRLDATTPFDLARGPLVRGKAIRLGEREHILMLNLHHIISDGWSLGVLFRELGAAVEALRDGRRPELPPLPVQYADYSVWQRQWLEEGGVLARQLAYWQEKLAGAPETLDLPTDEARPNVPAYAGAAHPFRLDAELTARLKRVAEERGGTLYMALLAALNALFHRYTGQEDICIGCPIANRQYGETEGLIGMFVNTLALRTAVHGEETFSALFDDVKRTCLEAYEHQDAPFERVVDALRLERNLAVTPLFQVMLVLQNAAAADPSVRLVPLDSGITKFDLTLDLTETADGLAGTIHYRTALFRPETIARMAGHFAALCSAATQTPNAAVGELNTLDAAETRLLLVTFNETGSDYPAAKCVDELFAEAAAAHADRLAVVDGDRALTFRELYDRGRELAAYLRSQGVTPDTRVGLCTGRSLEMVVGLIGIVQAGGAYVPLDPDYPADRLQYMIEDAAPALVLTQEQLRAHLPSTVPVVALDSEWETVARYARDNPPVAPSGVTPDNLAYVIYTSGSTGLPKGVMVRHGGAVNLWHALEQSIYAGHDDWQRVSVNASFAFDSSVKQFVQLLSGRTLVLVPQDVRLDAGALLRFAGEQSIDVFDCTPSQLVALLDAGLFDGRPIPKAFLIGGEAIDPALWRTLSECREAAFFNVYGPAECTVDATVARISADDAAPHIGGPIANVRVYILDRLGRPVPVGVAGEICIGGAGVARGYLNRAELTAERFVTDPFSDDPAARLYKTGDLGRWRPDGTIAYAGRNDQQVKLRGQRIELGEIESQLSSHPAVREAVVLAREDEPGERRLVAYVTAAGETPAPEELRAHLAARLPRYMVPAAFVTLDALPLTPNKKIDRKALPAPDALAYARKEYEPPRGVTEETLAAIWCELLHVERVGRHDNFFEIGGHSLLATQVISKVRARLDVDVPLKALFEQSTVAAFAERIATSSPNEIPPIRPYDRSGLDALPLSFAQERLWFINQLEPDSPGYNLPGAVLIREELDLDLLEEALRVIVARHESLRTVFPTRDGHARQVILDELDLNLERIDLSGETDEQARHEAARRLCHSEAVRLFDLERGPLLRAMAIRLADREHVLMLTMHHIVSDGWSVSVLIEELGAIVESLREGRRPALPPLPIQYADYSIWQRRWLEEGGVLARQLAYWQDKLAGVPESLEMPADYPRPSVPDVTGGSVTFTLDAQLTRQLARLAEAEGGTLYMALLAVSKVLLHRYSGQSDVCVGTPIANRQYGETEGLIGMFVNTLALRTQVEGDDTFAALLSKVKATCLEAYEHQDAPFEKVVDALRLQRNLSISPLFQVMVILQNTGRRTFAPSMTPYPLDGGISKFELIFEFSEAEEGLNAEIRYRTALYAPETIERMTRHFVAVCRALAARPAAKIGDVDYLDAAEKQRLLVEYNRTETEFPRTKCLHELIAEQVQLAPDAPAVVYGQQTLTYAELWQKSGAVASCLLARGVTAGTRVGLYTERSLEMVVGMLGILRAGGAYVPLDPDYPASRLLFMLEDAAPAVVLTQERLRERLHGTAALALDSEWSAIEQYAATAPSAGVTPGHLAYVIYTSGSTGMPKGVMVRHGGVVNLWNALERAVYAGHSDWTRVSVNASFSFDSSVKQFVQLLSGRTLVIVPQEVRLDGDALSRFLDEQRVDVFDCTPSQLVALRNAGFFDGARRVPKAFLIGGEAIDAKLWRALSERRDVAFYNVYGPAECTVDATVARITAEAPLPHIGGPVANARVYILDRRGNAVPEGVAGEICIGGAGVARGYLNRPDLTAERFVADPFSGDAHARLYKTGDLGRWRAGGTIEYIGRNDHQVKLRGQRIELGEIEAQLANHRAVREAVVIAREDEPGEKRLVAYLTTSEEIGPEELRTYLGARLPQYMVPAAFVELEALPLSPNRKVDRKALPRPEAAAYARKEYEPPRGAVEETLAAIWRELLHVERVGRHDNFFDLGGHSLSAVQLMARTKKQFHHLLPLATLFAAPTLAAFAELLAAGGGAPSFDILVPIQTSGSATPLFAVPGVGGNVLALRPLSRTLGPDQPFYGLQAAGLDGSVPPHTSVEETAKANVAALKRVQAAGPYRLLGHSYGGVVAYEMARLLLEQGEQVASLTLLDSFTPSVLRERRAAGAASSDLYVAAMTLANLYKIDVGDADAFRQLAFEENVPAFVALLAERGVEIDAAQFTTFYDVYRANLHCYRNYEPSLLPRDVDVSLYAATRNESGATVTPGDYGWNRYLATPIRVHHVEADHFSILERVHF